MFSCKKKKRLLFLINSCYSYFHNYYIRFLNNWFFLSMRNIYNMSVSSYIETANSS